MIYRFLLWLLGFEEICKQVDAIERELEAQCEIESESKPRVIGSRV